MKILDNYKQDLIKSLEKPLLIELNKKDLNLFGDDGLNKAALYSQYIYNEFINSSESTNLIFINADKYVIDKTKHKKIILLEEIISLTSQQIRSQKNINIAKAGVKGAFSYFTGPLIKNVIGDYVDAGIDEIADLFCNSIKDVIDFLGEEFNYNFTDKILNEITNKVNKTLNDTTSNMLEEAFRKKLNLSKKAKNKLDTISSQFNKDLTPVGIFSLVVQLLISIAINDEEKESSSNKLIFINNPHKLDENSLAVLSLLFSFAKDLKEKEKHTGISVVYCYSDEEFQPYQELKNDKYKISKKLLDEQRRFTQRYSMLERPSSDMPNMAVKSYTFVGREKELKILKEQFDKSKKDSKLKNLEIIKADPGIGKTKLVKKHIEQIEKSEKNGKRIIRLTLLNQVGHSSTNTGLSSLKDSILNEAKRLETIKTLENTVIDKIKDLAKSKTISTIEGLLGVNNIIEIGSSIKDAFDLEKNTTQMLEQSSEDINNKTKKSKEKQFEDIKKAILELKTIVYEGKAFKPFPIILFIDDLQWIDEDSSEFILKYLIPNEYIDIHIIATQRVSDATTSLKLAQENSSLNPYKISFLQQAGIKTDQTIDDPEDVTKLVTNIIDLKGLDKENLTELISLTIDPENKSEDKKQKDTTLAKSIIKNLINENQKDKEYVNTLFAIETINMLCDEKLYSSNEKIIEQLILQNPLRYNESIQEFSKTLEETFKILNEKYTDAFEHANSDKEFKQQFNLMAYAVLEERLYILHEYFGEYGNAAVNTLLFSSLLGTPFNSQIVKNVLEELSNTEEELLQPLKNYINESQQCNLNEVHYEIIEEVYEILSRYIHFNSAYSYKHNLLEMFLDKQLDYILDSKFEKENIIEAKDKLFELILTKVKKQEKDENFYGEKFLSLNIFQYYNLIFFKKIKQNILKKAFFNNKLNWSEKYITSLNITAKLYFLDGKVVESINLLVQSLEIIEEFYKNEPDIWSKDYARVLNRLSYIYFKLNDINKSINYIEKALEIRESLFFKKPNFFTEDYLKMLNKLTTLYIINKQVKLSEKTLKRILNIYEELYKESTSSSKIKYYIDSLNNLAKIYENNDQLSESIIINEKVLKIAEKRYSEKPRIWIKKYIQSIYKLSVLYLKNKLIDKAIILLEKAVILCEIKYKQNSYDWVKYYIKIMNKLATAYLENMQKRKAINLFEKAFEIIEILYNDNKSFWTKEYTHNLNNLGYVYFMNNQKEKAIKLFEKAFEIIEILYKENPKLWIKSYLNKLHNLTYSYAQNNQIIEAILLSKKAIEVIELSHMKKSKLWVKSYLKNLNHLVILYVENKNYKEAFIYCQKYFKVFNINILDRINNLNILLISPLIVYYQISIHLEKDINEFLLYIQNEIESIKDKFGNKYEKQLQIEYKKYLKFFNDSNDFIDKEKLEIFKKIFMEEKLNEK